MFLYFLLATYGLIIGSFVNALVWRTHTTSRGHKKPSIVRGRSMCVHCRHQLAWYDLVPLFSWLQLHGRCRYCHKEISVQYPLVEVITAVFFIFSYIFWPYIWTTVSYVLFSLWLVVVVLGISLAVSDVKYMLLPNRIVKLFTIAASVLVLAMLLMGFIQVRNLISTISGAAILFGLFYVLYTKSDGKWIGGGDVKLAASIGLLSGGIIQTMLCLFIASMLGSLAVIPGLLFGKVSMKARIPFGPLLLMAAFLVYIFGSQFMSFLAGALLTSSSY